jgi:hypothetical protein
MNPGAKSHPLLLAALFLGFLAVHAAATTHYVDVNSPNPLPPYTDWSTAATNIQDAVKVTVDGDTVLVTNGVYRYGGVNSAGQINRVMLTNSITLVGMGGSQATTIFGGMNTECVFMISNSVLTGFTLTNGDLPGGGSEGGGVFFDGGGVVSNCFIANNSASIGGGVYGNGTVYNSTVTNNIASEGAVVLASLYNCTVISNTGATNGGGLYDATASNCFIAYNYGGSSSLGGGAYNSTVYNSTIIGNQANVGGGAFGGQLFNCSILTNSAAAGGGTYGSFLSNCVVSGNYASGSSSVGGGAKQSTNYNCTYSGNSAVYGGAGVNTTFYNCLLVSNTALYGGGAYGAINTPLNNCTIVGNTATNNGGGVSGCTINNSIIYYNTAPTGSNWNSSAFILSCSTPAKSGVITNEPVFVNMAGGDFHLQSNSPCINAGNNSYVTSATDLDGNPRVVGGTVDIGTYEYQSPVSMVSYLWLEKYRLTITSNIDTSSPNGTGFTVYQDWVAGLNPTNPASVLVMLPVTTTNTTSGIKVTWQSVSGINYNLQRTTNLPTAFSTIQSNIVGNAGTTSYMDTSATNGGLYFYRVGVP